MTDLKNCPEGYHGPNDERLLQIARRLWRLLAETQRQFDYGSLRLSRDALRQLASLLVDFAEDLHCDIGIWRAYERYNIQFFGTALPLTQDHRGDPPTLRFSADRFRHLLWILYPEFVDGLLLSPGHRDLHKLAEAGSGFLADAFRDLPHDSGVKAFLQAPNDDGWDVKHKWRTSARISWSIAMDYRWRRIGRRRPAGNGTRVHRRK